MAKSYISLKTVADKLLRHPLMAGISYEAIIDYCIDFMRIVACPNIFVEKSIEYEVKDYTIGQYNNEGKFIPLTLPEDFYEIIQIRSGNSTLHYSTDSFHMSENKNIDNYNPDLTYKIQNNTIYTSFKEGNIEIMYSAFMIEDGYPMIPDNSKFTRALEAYIKKQWFTILFDLGKLQGAILQNAQQEYAWAVGACETEFNKLTLDKAESFYNSFKGAILHTNNNQHREGFINLGNVKRNRRNIYTRVSIEDLKG